MYIGLWSRLEGFEREALTRALVRKTVIQATLMRATIHLVSRRDYWPLQRAIEEGLREWWVRVNRADGGRIRKNARRARAILADGPRQWKELEKLLGGREEARGIFTWLPLVRVPPSGTWERRRFLPTWDATLLVHARRTQILPEEYRPRIFGTKTPNSFNTFLVDGSVAGTWRYDGGRIVLDPFRRLDAATRRELGEEAERLASFLS
jgi:hypothetical protein